MRAATRAFANCARLAFAAWEEYVGLVVFFAGADAFCPWADFVTFFAVPFAAAAALGLAISPIDRQTAATMAMGPVGRRRRVMNSFSRRGGI